MRKLYISDLDGTLLNSNQRLSKSTIERLNRLIATEKLNFSIATARSLNSAWPLIKEVNLTVPIILHNGSFVFDTLTGKYINKNTISSDLLTEVLEKLYLLDLKPIVYTFSETNGNKVLYTGIFNRGEEDYIGLRLKANDQRFVLVDNLNGIVDEIITILVIDDENKVRDSFEQLKNDSRFYCHLTLDIYSKFYWLEVGSTNANKKMAVNFLKKYLGIDSVISFGDNTNDLPLFEASDESFAVANCHNDLKSICTGIIGHNDDDAVVDFIENRLRNEHLTKFST